uniref:Uncharacterized protein n=1 Tax=Oryza nivara TaxID=4536 RepID=A0A0E0GYS7_ORYNI
MPAVGRSPSSEHCRPNPRTNTVASTRQTHSHTITVNPITGRSKVTPSPVPAISLPFSTGNHPPRTRDAQEHTLPSASPPSSHQSPGAPPPPPLVCSAGREEEDDRRKKKKEKKKKKKG